MVTDNGFWIVRPAQPGHSRCAEMMLKNGLQFSGNLIFLPAMTSSGMNALKGIIKYSGTSRREEALFHREAQGREV
jgi:hypothetical protein